MKILIYGINFAPEPVGIGRYTGEMAQQLRAAGHEVRVITALPYYPEWKVAPGYRPWAYAFETWQGMPVARAPLWVPFRPGGPKRVLHLLTFAATSLPLLVRQWFWRPDVVWMAAPALVCAPAALLTARLCGARSWLHVQDFEVDIAFGMGLLSSKGGRLKRLALGLEKVLLHGFDRVSTISQAMLAKARGKGLGDDRLRYVPNWADVDAVKPLAGPSPYRAELGIPDEAVVALYSGSMGVKQGIDYVAEAAVALQAHTNLYVVLCGDGALREAAVQRCGHLPRVRFLPFQPVERLGDLLGLADVHLLPQRAGAAELVMPSKLTGMLASGRPVVGMADQGSELAGVLQGCGAVVPHGDVAAFAAAIEALAADAPRRARQGAWGRAHADQHLATQAVLGGLERQLRDLVEGPQATATTG